MQIRFVFVFSLVMGIATSGFAVEPWSDSRLPVTDGLTVWLDASRMTESYQANKRKPLADGDPVELWMDGSGAQRHLLQRQDARRPRFHQFENARFIQFDGQQQYFQVSQLGQSFPDCTIFVVTATFSNPAPFSGWLAMSGSGQNDFESGLNVDQGVSNQPTLSVINVEGSGTLGMENLVSQPIPYGQVKRLCVSSSEGKSGIALWVDGQRQGERDRAAGKTLHMDEFVVGARYYSIGGPPEVRGFLHGEIGEVLVFNRLLTTEERESVEKYLETKYSNIAPLPVPTSMADGKPLERIPSPPLAQIFVPGFAVCKLPVELSNINNLLYRPDGKLVALGYDGNIWLLTDSNGDGLEDQASLFWENNGRIRSPIGMDLTPPRYRAGFGVFVASKGKCSLILDSDRDDRADKEIVIAEGWKESPHGVDALGVAVDPRDSSVYFGLGTENFGNAYLVNQDGTAKYDIHSERGTIMRVAPDFGSRETVCTGIRFPVAMRFNKVGDLFCTDQEGATWLANGNPLDELLHVQPHRHYGFPPRHPRHLPNVIDEPSTYDYGPQHQSTCGFCFDEPTADNGPTFGPKDWAGDAFVTGYSRGKLFHTQLAKTPAGYIARNSIFATLNQLTADCCITPSGDMVVACHSGGPDWGTGPTGNGTLLKIRYADREHPQPAIVWPAGPREIRVEFDRPVEPGLLRNALDQIDVTKGLYVRAGDQFESLWPGYAVVSAQQRTPRKNVTVFSAQLTADRRTLVLATEPLNSLLHYALILPGMGRPDRTQTSDGQILQHPRIDLDFDITGVEAEWTQQGRQVWKGWLPSADLEASRVWTRGSASHDRLWQAMQEKGDLTLAMRLNLVDMLRPAVQLGSKIDYAWPDEEVLLNVTSQSPRQVQISTKSTSTTFGTDKTAAIPLRLQRDQLVDVNITIQNMSLSDSPVLQISYSTNEDPRLRPLPPHRSYLPWSMPPEGQIETLITARPKELEGGSWARGWKIFHDPRQGCARCHSVQGQGGRIGPDLSNLIHRDYASVMRDITQPSFAINPDYLTATLTLHDGRVLTGVVRTIDGQFHVGDTNGKTTIVMKTEIDEMRMSPVSIMPDGMLKNFTPEQTRDLMTYLLTSTPSMPREEPAGASRPVARSLPEIRAVLGDVPSQSTKPRPLRIVLVAGAKDHGPGEHDYPAWAKAWCELLSIGEELDVATAMEWPEKSEFQKADVMVFYQRGSWTPPRAADIDAFLERGGGLVYVHYAVDGQADAPGFAKRIALAWGNGARFRHGPLSIHFNHDPTHPVSRGFTTLKLIDESYWRLQGSLASDRILGTGIEENQPQPLFWSVEHGPGRVFVSIPGHYSWTFDDPLFRLILLRGIAWSAHEPVDRFNELIWPGADIAK